jgi:hypothetical protein
MADLLPLHIVARDGAWLVLARPDDAVVSSHASLKGGALDAVLGTPGFIARDPRFGAGEWRWIDMTATEDAPAPDGSQVTERGIQSMAARLNSGDPIMVDGGSRDSGAHASLFASDTRANGWVHLAVEVRDESGRLHLWGRVEVLAPIAADMDANRLALGSIGFATDGGDNNSASLVQHALTNIPAVQGLTPAGSPRAASAPVVHFRSSRVAGEQMDPKTDTQPADAKPRDFMADALAAMGLPPNTSPEDALKALAEKFKPAEPPADDEAAKAADAAKSEARTLALQVAALRADVERMKPAAEAHAKRERDDKIDAACHSRGLKSAAVIASAREHAEKFGEAAALDLIAKMAAPPTGSIAQPSKRTQEAPESALGAPVADEAAIDAAAELLMDEVRKSHPREARHVQFGRARKLAVARNPSLGAA